MYAHTDNLAHKIDRGVFKYVIYIKKRRFYDEKTN